MAKRKTTRKDSTVFPQPTVKDGKASWRINDLSKNEFRRLAQWGIMSQRIELATLNRWEKMWGDAGLPTESFPDTPKELISALGLAKDATRDDIEAKLGGLKGERALEQSARNVDLLWTDPLTLKQLAKACGCHERYVACKVLSKFRHRKIGARVQMLVGYMPANWQQEHGYLTKPDIS